TLLAGNAQLTGSSDPIQLIFSPHRHYLLLVFSDRGPAARLRL
ncbi:MAG: hypothetical protein JWQ74_3696, partial [Marmoricola sp.]|nr:hypothetical protein [Marmoricola sp.]